MQESFEKLRVTDETALLKYFEDTFNLKTINTIMEYKESESPDHFLPFYMRGYYLPVYDEFGGIIFEVCKCVATQLGFGEKKIEFYVANDPSFNSSSIYSNKEEVAHIVIINRGLIEKVSQEELAFIIGHEIGHLIYRHTYASRVIQFVYPSFETLPQLLKKLYSVWSQVCEISADRIGLLACNNVETAVRALFKLSSGLEDKYFNAKLDSLLSLVDKTYTEMKSHPSYMNTSHPANPIRIKALQAFAESQLLKSLSNAVLPDEDKSFETKMTEILSLIKKAPLDENEENELKFLTSAGLVLMGSDKCTTQEEYDYLVNILAKFIHWPSAYLKSMLNEDIDLIRINSAKAILAKSPWKVQDLAEKLFFIVLSDRNISDIELDTFSGIAIDELRISRSAVADIILAGIRKYYRPLS
jgi:hypothetical protein